MIWFTLVILVILLGVTAFQFYLLRKQQLSIDGFDVLLGRFIETNQQFYDSQKNIIKQDKEIFEYIIKQSSEISSIRKHNSAIQLGIKNVTDTIRLLKDCQKDIKLVSDQLKSNSNLTSSLATISNNIKLLDRVISNINQKK